MRSALVRTSIEASLRKRAQLGVALPIAVSGHILPVDAGHPQDVRLGGRGRRGRGRRGLAHPHPPRHLPQQVRSTHGLPHGDGGRQHARGREFQA